MAEVEAATERWVGVGSAWKAGGASLHTRGVGLSFRAPLVWWIDFLGNLLKTFLCIEKKRFKLGSPETLKIPEIRIKIVKKFMLFEKL